MTISGMIDIENVALEILIFRHFGNGAAEFIDFRLLFRLGQGRGADRRFLRGS